MRRAFVLVGLCACVSDPPAGSDASMDAKGMGGAGQPCYGNGTCDGALSCRSNVCVDLATDSSVSDSTSDTSPGDAGDGGCGLVVPTQAGVQCPGMTMNCSATQICCVVGQTGTCSSTPCSGQDFEWGCDKKQDCLGGSDVCCLKGGATTMSTCPVVVSPSSLSPLAWCIASTCGSNPQLCATSSECDGGKCVPANFQKGGNSKIVGICQ